MHSGGGDQYNYHWSIGFEEQLIRRGAARLEIVREHRHRLARCFVRPHGYSRAADRLTEAGAVVILDGRPGAGRRSAATMLLAETSVPGGRIEELPLNREEGVPEPSPDDSYLLDLSRVSDGDYPAAQQTLILYRSLVEKCGARMVAVSPAGLRWMLDPELAPLAVSIERPRGRAVLSRHLRVWGVRFTYEQLVTDELTHMFATAPMRDLDRLGELVVQARDSARYGTDFAHWRDEAVAAATNWSQEVAGQLREHQGIRERALLLAAAMTNGAAAHTVLGAAHTLVEVLRYPKDETPGLAREGLGEQLEKLSLVREGDGRVRFARLAYDGAVRRHFWENFPELRQGFRDWVGQCVRLPALDAEDRARILSRFGEQALSAGRPEDLFVLIERWTQESAGGRLRAEAAALLELGLSHEQYGWPFRSRVYQWARTSRLPPDLARVLTDVCRHVIAVTHPGQALVRLRHLVLRQDNSAATALAARTAMVKLTRDNRQLYRRELHSLLEVAGPKGHTRLDVLLALLEPAELIIEPPWREFTLGWRAVMVARPPATWAPIVRRWLTLVARRQASGRVLSALLLAASGDRDLLNQLYVTTCEWSDVRPADVGEQTADEGRSRTADRFCREIDLALGVGAASPGSGAQVTRDGT